MAVVGALAAAHDHSSKVAIAGPDEQGAFPPVWRPGSLGDGVPPVVLDANVLRNDVRYACERDRRTVLVTAANSGAIRLFAASHVVEEVAEHAEGWARESKKVSAGQFRHRFATEYLPLIRVIADQALTGELLAPEEKVRVDRLAAVDPDDLPSVTLALVLQAFYLSEDARALRAVYGEALDRTVHHAWMERLKAGGDAGELGRLVFAAGAIPMAVGAGLFAGSRWIARRYSPWALVPVGLAISVLVYLKPPSPVTRAKIEGSIGEYILAVGHAYSRYLEAYREFIEVAAPPPVSADGADADGLLCRRVMHRLARAPEGRLSPAEIDARLGSTQATSEFGRIEELLQAGASFAEPYRERWQLGNHVVAPEVAPVITVSARRPSAMPLPETPASHRLRAAAHPLALRHG